jgi:hypothetical protein
MGVPPACRGGTAVRQFRAPVAVLVFGPHARNALHPGSPAPFERVVRAWLTRSRRDAGRARSERKARRVRSAACGPSIERKPSSRCAPGPPSWATAARARTTAGLKCSRARCTGRFCDRNRRRGRLRVAGLWIRMRSQTHHQAGPEAQGPLLPVPGHVALAAGHDPAWCAAQTGDPREVFLRRDAT